MSFAGLNWIAIIVAAIAAFGVGAAWYGVLFSKQWLAAVGKTEAEIRANATPVPYVVSGVASIVMAAVLSALMHALAQATIAGGLWLAFLIWLGFVLTTMAVNNGFAQQKRELLVIDSGHWLAVLLVIGLILGIFG
jgi:hypothetical protein